MQEYSANKRVVQYPAVYDDVVVLPPSPTPLEGEPAPQNIQAGLLIVVGANLAVMVIVMGGMWFGGINPITAILAGVGYFTLTSPLYLSIVTGVLSNLIGRHEREITERQRVEAYRELGTMSLQWRVQVERSRQMEMQPALPPYRPDVGGAQRVSPLNTFVEPYADTERAALEAVRWAEQLYDRTGLGAPDPRKVQLSGESMGRLKVRMIGSKRGGGSQEAGVFLLREGVIRKVAGGYALRLEAFPYRHTLHTLLSLRGDVVGGNGWVDTGERRGEGQR